MRPCLPRLAEATFTIQVYPVRRSVDAEQVAGPDLFPIPGALTNERDFRPGEYSDVGTTMAGEGALRAISQGEVPNPYGRWRYGYPLQDAGKQ